MEIRSRAFAEDGEVECVEKNDVKHFQTPVSPSQSPVAQKCHGRSVSETVSVLERSGAVRDLFDPLQVAADP